MSGWVLLHFSIIGALLVANAAWPTRGPWTLLPSWIGVFLTTDLVFHHIALQIFLVTVFSWFGALLTLPGQAAVLIMVISSMILIKIWLPALQAQSVVVAVAAEHQLDEVERVPRALLRTPFRKTRDGVRVIRDVEFHRVFAHSLKLDIFLPDAAGNNRPALVYVHGGGWVYGDKKDQGLPLCSHLASLGWVCFNINYRLSPLATWPDHLVDAKAAIAWVREHAGDYGVDPGFVAISGGSAGGHISAMAALTQGREDLQPGFEDADTTLQAIVTSYGVYDMKNRLGAHNPEFTTRMVAPLIIKADPRLQPEKFAAASPRDHTDKASIPWLILHGTDDELAPIVETRDFHKALRRDSTSTVAYAELPAASHAFDIYYCHRAIAAVDLTARFLATAFNSSKDSSRQMA